MTENEENKSKENIRKKMLELRASLTSLQVHEKSLAICGNLIKSGIMDDMGLVFLFAPVRNEPDMFLVHDILKKQYPYIPTAYPKVFIRDGCRGEAVKGMDFYFVDDYRELKCGYMHIMEPDTADGAKCLQKADLSSLKPGDKKALIIIPGLAFDLYGNRTGYGGGFYDRYLQPYAENDNIVKAAVCYDFQRLNEILNNSPHDVKMDYIFTENTVLRIGRVV